MQNVHNDLALKWHRNISVTSVIPHLRRHFDKASEYEAWRDPEGGKRRTARILFDVIPGKEKEAELIRNYWEENQKQRPSSSSSLSSIDREEMTVKMMKPSWRNKIMMETSLHYAKKMKFAY